MAFAPDTFTVQKTGQLEYLTSLSLLDEVLGVFALTGEALTQSSLLEADGENMTTAVEPMNLHHAMLRSPGSVCTHRALILQSALILMNHNYTVRISDATVRLEKKWKTTIRLWASWCFDQLCFWLKPMFHIPVSFQVLQIQWSFSLNQTSW